MDEESTPRRGHRSLDEVRPAVEAWRVSGLSLAAFASQQGLAPETLRRWRERVRRADGLAEEPAQPGFLPLMVVDGQEGPGLAWELPRGLGRLVGPRADLAGVLALLLGMDGAAP